MTINIQKTALNIRIRKMIVIIGFTALVVIVAITEIIDKILPDITKTQAVFILLILFFLLAILNFMMDYRYIFYSDEGNKILLRYYSLRIFSKTKNSIEIPKDQFYGFELKKYCLGLKEYVVLQQNIKNKVANYPAICLSALTKKEKNKLKASLIRFSTK